jgi:hypothetical protein
MMTPGNAPPPTAAPVPSTCKAGEGLPRARVYPLSPRQYANTVKQLFGVDVPVDGLPANGAVRGPFTEYDTAADVGTVQERGASLFRDNAARIAQAALPRALKDHACLDAAAPPKSCADAFVGAYGALAFRRPLEPAEATRLGAFYAKAATTWGGKEAARLTISVLVQSPSFLYRTELGTGTGARLTLTGHELASQLAYMITAKGRLSDRAVVRSHAERLVASPGARRKSLDFLTQYLHMGKLQRGEIAKDPKAFPGFDDALQTALAEETRTFLDREIWEAGVPFHELFTARHSYLSAKLASHYGVPKDALGTQMQKVTLPEGRRGLLSHAGLLAALSGEEETSPTHRGLFLLNSLLCDYVPDPPPGAADEADGRLNSSDPMATQREHFEHARKAAPECMGCHGRFMPLGLGLERFDPVGRYRTTEFGKTIDARVSLTGHGALDGEYEDALAMAEAVTKSAPGRACLALQYATYALGTVPGENDDSCWIDQTTKGFGAGKGRLQDLIVELTQNDVFYFRAGGTR